MQRAEKGGMLFTMCAYIVVRNFLHQILFLLEALLQQVAEPLKAPRKLAVGGLQNGHEFSG